MWDVGEGGGVLGAMLGEMQRGGGKVCVGPVLTLWTRPLHRRRRSCRGLSRCVANGRSVAKGFQLFFLHIYDLYA